MKTISIALLLAGITFTTAALAQEKTSSAAGTSAPAAQQSPQPPATVATVVDHEIIIVEKEVVEAAEAMPEEKYNFSPANLKIVGSDYEGVRTFGEQVEHIAASNYLIWSPVIGEKVPETANEGKGPESMKAKAEIIQFLKESFALGHKAAGMLTTANLVEPIPMGKNKSNRLFLCTFAAAHAFDHYGQMAEYLRMNGIVPPASRKKSE